VTSVGGAGPVHYLSQHPLLAALSVAGASSAAGVFIARAAHTESSAGRVGWSALALLEVAIAGGIVMAVAGKSRHHRVLSCPGSLRR